MKHRIVSKRMIALFMVFFMAFTVSSPRIQAEVNEATDSSENIESTTQSTENIEVTTENIEQIEINDSDSGQENPEEPTINSITASLTKTEYFIGDELDLTGLTVIATYSDGHTGDVTEDATVTGFDSSKYKQINLTVSVKDVTTTIPVYINAGGTCGENVTWFAEKKTDILTISGSGAMTDYSKASEAPWYTSLIRNYIKKVIIEDGVTTVGDYAFGISYKLVTEVSLPESVKKIGEKSFSGNTNLTSINLGNVTTIGNSAFYNVKKLVNPDLSNVTVYGEYAFQNCSSITDADLRNAITIGSSAFIGTKLTEVQLDNAVTVGDNAFMGIAELQKVSFGDVLESIGLMAFSGTGIKEITVPGIQTVDNSAFNNCKSLEKVIVENGLVRINDLMFMGDTALKEVTIPESVTTIGNSAFQNCTSLETVNYTGTYTQWKAISFGQNNEPLLYGKGILISSASVVFDGLIRVKYYFEMPEGLKTSSNCYLVFTKGDTEVYRVPFSEGQGNDSRTFDYSVYPDEFADLVTVKAVAQDGSVIKMVGSQGTDYTESGFAYSPKNYGEYMAVEGSTNEMKALASAFLDYGAAASIYFGGTGEISDAVNSVSESDFTEYSIIATGEKPEGFTGASISVMFEADNAIRIYYAFGNGVSPEDFIFSIDGENATLNTEKNYLTVTNIAADDLDKEHTFAISKGNSTYSITASVLSYAKRLVDTGIPEKQNLGKALYLYDKAAEGYFNN